jgi:hypothetical protein
MSSNNDYGGGGVLEISRNVSKTHGISRKVTESLENSRNLSKSTKIYGIPWESIDFCHNLQRNLADMMQIQWSVPYVATNPDDYSFLNLLVKHCQQDAGLWNAASNTYAIWGYFGSLFKKQTCQEGVSWFLLESRGVSLGTYLQNIC